MHGDRVAGGRDLGGERRIARATCSPTRKNVARAPAAASAVQDRGRALRVRAVVERERDGSRHGAPGRHTQRGRDAGTSGASAGAAQAAAAPVARTAAARISGDGRGGGELEDRVGGAGEGGEGPVGLAAARRAPAASRPRATPGAPATAASPKRW